MRRGNRPVINTDCEPRLWAKRALSWILSDSVPTGALLAALERKTWIDDETICPQTHYRLAPGQLAALKLRIAQRVKAAGGEFATGWGVVRSVDGETFTTHLAAPAQAAEPAPLFGATP
jgi:hypothetical protein